MGHGALTYSRDDDDYNDGGQAFKSLLTKAAFIWQKNTIKRVIFMQNESGYIIYSGKYSDLECSFGLKCVLQMLCFCYLGGVIEGALLESRKHDTLRAFLKCKIKPKSLENVT